MPAPANPHIQADRLRRHQRALADFGLEAFRATGLDGLLHRAACLVSEALDVELVKILEHVPERGELLIRAGVNWKPGVVGNMALGAGSGSPGGYALVHEEAVISPDVATETRFSIPPVLNEHGVRSMANVVIAGEGRAFGVLEVDAREERTFDDDDVAFLRNYANLLAAAVDRLRTHAELAEALEHRQVLMLELQHRVKNILALVQSLAGQSAAGGRTIEEFKRIFLERVRALAESHSLLFGHHGDGADLQTLVERTVLPYRTGTPQAVTIDGAPTPVTAKQGLTLGLILHELSTNAAKYGALSTANGHVGISWTREGAQEGGSILLKWEERGGPSVAPPERQGFGTRMIERSASYDLNGQAELTYGERGFSCEISFPAAPERHA